MNKIINLSQNGFQLDEWFDSPSNIYIHSRWFTCDKYRIFKNPARAALFQSLKVGDELELTLNSKGYVIDFKLNSQSSPSLKEGSLPSPGHTRGNGEVSNLGQDTLINPIKGGDVGTNSNVSVSEGGSKVPTPSDTLIQSGKNVLESDGGRYSPQKATALNSNIEPSSVQVSKDGRIYGQCVNLAFHSLTAEDVVLDFEMEEGIYPNIDRGFLIADLIYDEYIKRLK